MAHSQGHRHGRSLSSWCVAHVAPECRSVVTLHDCRSRTHASTIRGHRAHQIRRSAAHCNYQRQWTRHPNPFDDPRSHRMRTSAVGGWWLGPDSAAALRAERATRAVQPRGDCRCGGRANPRTICRQHRYFGRRRTSRFLTTIRGAPLGGRRSLEMATALVDEQWPLTRRRR